MASVRRLRLPVSESRRELRPSNVHSSEMTRRLRPSKGNCFCDGSKRSVSGRGFLQGRLLLLVFLASARNGIINLEQYGIGYYLQVMCSHRDFVMCQNISI